MGRRKGVFLYYTEIVTKEATCRELQSSEINGVEVFELGSMVSQYVFSHTMPDKVLTSFTELSH